MYYQTCKDNPLNRYYQTYSGMYSPRFMTAGAWLFIVDDFGNAVPAPLVYRGA